VDTDTANTFGEQPFARLTRQLEDIQHRPLLYVAQTGRSAHAVGFHEAMEDHLDLFLGEPNIRPEWLLLWLRESLATLLALVPLNSVLSIESTLHHFDPTGMAYHLALAFSSGLGQNGSGCHNPAIGASPRLCLADSPRCQRGELT
jgi:hypothetical protein